MQKIDKEQLELINSYLAGAHTSWEQIGVAFFVLLLVGVVIFALVASFFNDRKSDLEEQDLKRKEATKKIVGQALMISGLAAMLYAIVLMLSM